MIWADNAIQNQWLQVTVLAGASTGLAAQDIFYFGNLVGESGNDATVTVADEDAALNNRTVFTLASITNNYDYNRDRQVNAADGLIARQTYTGPQAALQLISAPVASPPAAGDSLQPLVESAAATADISASAVTDTTLAAPVETALATPVVDPAAATVAAAIATTANAPPANMPVTLPSAAITAQQITSSPAQSLADAGNLASASNGDVCQSCLDNQNIDPLYMPFDLYQASTPIPSAFGSDRLPGIAGLPAVSRSLSSQPEIERQARQQGISQIDNALIHDTVLGGTAKAMENGSEMNLNNNYLIDEMTEIIMKDQISKKPNRPKAR